MYPNEDWEGTKNHNWIIFYLYSPLYLISIILVIRRVRQVSGVSTSMWLQLNQVDIALTYEVVPEHSTNTLRYSKQGIIWLSANVPVHVYSNVNPCDVIIFVL